ncbi:MAG: hypothetical protein FWE38_01045 [Firmicutes bacterium]|nr:hypothetical protein [Bacillota bacterium]
MRKAFAICAVLISFFVLGGMAYAPTHVTMGNMENYNATIHRGGFFYENAVITTQAEMEMYIQKIMAEFLRDDAIVPDGYWQQMESMVREFYGAFNEEFFTSQKLVIAMVDQGSGNVKYAAENLAVEDGVATITIRRDAPMIQTMDFVTWILLLEVPNTYTISQTVVNLI